MKEIYTQIEINAPIEKVWKILLNFREYHKWNSFITRIFGSPVVGARLQILLSPPGRRSFSFSPEIIVFDDNDARKELAWIGKSFSKSIFQGEHHFIVEKINNNRTRFIHAEKFYGLLTPLFHSLLVQTEKGFRVMNRDLKNISES